jgi:hypothetical protein
VDLLPVETVAGSTPILAVPARLDRDAAIVALARGVPGAVRRLARGPLRSVAQVYVPFRLHDVSLCRGRRTERLVIGVDAVAGSLDLYRFGDPAAAVAQVRTGNHLDPLLPPSAARDIVSAAMTRVMYQRVGFLASSRWRVDVQPIDEILYVPYWLGFFGRRATASLVVVDAVRRQIEGVKMRRLLEEWLRATPAV